ncbi:tail fiber domain-containing protein [Microbaculum marinisediminis]|uniref:Tail fiber domain-containing protein n=1 Tax=Microbaculum marinisediminis TaxID=2931392 RepID=A0AAW5QV50_9HYPH|nr:tail fiber domain-containing protein [Microbaculum sp. A6E488]MCT8970784.1 tail fiber domain-containing protein [Microbaculum sp. A6E488]
MTGIPEPQYSSAGGSATTPGGNDTEIQFNSAGTFDGDADLTWNAGTNTMNTINIDYTGYITDISDKRLKENIVPLENSFEGIMALQAYSFTMKDDQNRAVEYGLMAQDVQTVFPELVKTHENGMLSLNYIGLIAPLIETVKAQQSEIEKLRSRLDALEARYGTGIDEPATETGEQ